MRIPAALNQKFLHRTSCELLVLCLVVLLAACYSPVQPDDVADGGSNSDGGSMSDSGGMVDRVDGGIDGGAAAPIAFSGACNLMAIMTTGKEYSACDLSMLVVTRVDGTPEDLFIDGPRGTFTIMGDETAVTERWISLGREHWLTSARSVSLEVARVGRGDLVRVVSPTPVHVHLPRVPLGWSAGFRFDAFSLDSQARYDDLVPPTAQMRPGASVEDFVVEWSAAALPHGVRATDSLFLLGRLLEGPSADGRLYYRIPFPGIAKTASITSGESGEIEGPLYYSKAGLIMLASMSDDDFLRPVIAASPRATADRHATSLMTLPSVDFAYDSGSPLVLYAEEGSYQAPLEGAITRTPTPDWPLIRVSRFDYLQRVTLPIGTVALKGTISITTKGVRGSTWYTQDVYPVDKGVRDVPLVGPANGIRVNGVAVAEEVLEGAGTEPELAWNPPALGSATDYALRLHRAFAGEAGVALELVATLHTSHTSVHVPPGILTAGEYYIVELVAIQRSEPEPHVYLRRKRYPHGSASLIGGALRP